MNIIFSEERMPGQAVVDKMMEAGRLCILEEGLNPDPIVVSVTFVDEEEIHELNKQYRGVDRITDVLSFPQFDDLDNIPEEGEVCIGDVVICPEQALLQAVPLVRYLSLQAFAISELSHRVPITREM